VHVFGDGLAQDWGDGTTDLPAYLNLVAFEDEVVGEALERGGPHGRTRNRGGTYTGIKL